MIQKANKAENKVWKMIAPIVVLTCIGLVITAALAVTNQLTAPVIAAQQQAARDASMKVVLPDGEDFQLMENVTGIPETVLPEIYKAGNDAGYVIFVTGKGFGGDMSIIVGLDNSGAIVGTRVLEQSETQGIGSKAIEALPALIVEANGTTGVDAVSGATITSSAILSAVEECLNQA